MVDEQHLKVEILTHQVEVQILTEMVSRIIDSHKILGRVTTAQAL